MTIQTFKRQILPILKSEGVTKAAIFGSFATGKAKKGSDLDLLVRFKKNTKPAGSFSAEVGPGE